MALDQNISNFSDLSGKHNGEGSLSSIEITVAL